MRYEDDPFPDARTVRPWIKWGGLAVVVLLIAVGIWIVRYVHVEAATTYLTETLSIDPIRQKLMGEVPAYKPEPDRPEPVVSSPPQLPKMPTQVASLPPSRVSTTTVTPAAPPKREHWPAIHLHAKEAPPETTGEPTYALGDDFLPCVLETVLNSEIEGLFTVKLRRPAYDTTGRRMLLAQDQRIIAQDESAQLLYGNERIPTFALSFKRRDGSVVELGRAPIMDAAGINGLTGKVDNHTWRLIWTSILKGGLQGGQQVIQQQIGQEGVGPIAGGISRDLSNASQQRLGRSQDTRPTIEVSAGQLCQVLVPKPLHLVEVASR